MKRSANIARGMTGIERQKTTKGDNMYPKCKYCGSLNVFAEACVWWSEEDQAWTVSTVYDKSYSCKDCDQETDIVWG